MRRSSRMTIDRRIGTRVVIVEDNESIAKYLRYVLEHEGGYDVVETQSGDEVVDLAREPATAIVLMDVSLRSTQYRGRFVDGLELTAGLLSWLQLARRQDAVPLTRDYLARQVVPAAEHQAECC